MWEEQKGYSSVEMGLRFMKLFSALEYALASLPVCGVRFMQSGCGERYSQAGKAPGSQKPPGAYITRTPAFATGTLRGRSRKLDKKRQEQYTGDIKNLCSDKEHQQMGEATRTTKLLLDLGQCSQGGANTGKRMFLTETVAQLTAARAFYIDFF